MIPTHIFIRTPSQIELVTTPPSRNVRLYLSILMKFYSNKKCVVRQLRCFLKVGPVQIHPPHSSLHIISCPKCFGYRPIFSTCIQYHGTFLFNLERVHEIEGELYLFMIDYVLVNLTSRAIRTDSTCFNLSKAYHNKHLHVNLESFHESMENQHQLLCG